MVGVLARPAAPLGNDFYAPTTSANQKVCKEIVGEGFKSLGVFTLLLNFHAATRLYPSQILKRPYLLLPYIAEGLQLGRGIKLLPTRTQGRVSGHGQIGREPI